ncbi:MAG: bifunctional 3-hydroxydecanoyl-ACP dehydratase/trans-2-decenoyl-ACP isomerase [Gammaproteobacteria bacterium AqS3]|nr:bifunctional 3-hydroxydecanoyl-ACP dehydratase/trans-2-decenoyl-ACP isomerase [Gammaproteobacteria bacterium AqS3]
MPQEPQQQSVSYSREQLVDAGFGRLLPQGSAPLPIDPMLMVDRITLMSNTGGAYDKGVVEAEMDIRPDLWFFDCHFVNDPVMPGCLGLDGMWQLAGFFLTWTGRLGRGRALGADSIKFSGEVTPENKLIRYLLSIKRTSARGAASMVIADGSLEVDGKNIYTALGLRVGIFDRSAEAAG